MNFLRDVASDVIGMSQLVLDYNVEDDRDNEKANYEIDSGRNAKRCTGAECQRRTKSL